MRHGLLLASLIAALGAIVAGAATGQTPTYTIPGATPAAASLISNFEGFCAHPYNDGSAGCGTTGNGNCTIGYGQLLHTGPCTAADDAAYPDGVTRQQALATLQANANAAANAVDRLVTAPQPLTANERDALTSFTYNEGAGRLAGSQLLRDLNAGNTQAAANQFQRWIYANGGISQGLVNRRNEERCYFLQGSTACTGQLRFAVLSGVAPFAGAAGTTSAARARRRATLHVVSGAARGGSKVRLTGSGFTGGAVRLVAYVPGPSPYARVVLHARAGANGRFTVTWKVARTVVDGLPWTVTATERHHSATTSLFIAAF
jgi:lysozyme